MRRLPGFDCHLNSVTVESHSPPPKKRGKAQAIRQFEAMQEPETLRKALRFLSSREFCPQVTIKISDTGIIKFFLSIDATLSLVFNFSSAKIQEKFKNLRK